MNIFEYLDFRKLLKDLYDLRKSEQPSFSYRYIAMKVGFKSAGFFSNILTGKRNISENIAFKFAELFKFNKKETTYFEALVNYCQATDHERRKYYFEKVLSLRKSKAHPISADQYEYFSHWYNVAIRELVNYYPFRGDFQALAKQLTPHITPAEAKKSIELLLKLELIEIREDNTYRPTEKTITTVPHVPLVAIHGFQRETMNLAKEAIDRFPRDKRSISTLTLSLSEETYQAIEDKLAKFRSDVLDMVKNDTKKVDRVYQFNFQIFPFTDANK